jgi:hypothetical protein
MPVNATAPSPTWQWAARPAIQTLRRRQGRPTRENHSEHARSSRPMACANGSPRNTQKIAGVQHFIEDHEDPWAAVNCYRDSTVPGS